MSLRPHALESVPDETARVARAAFPKGHPYITCRDALGTIFQDKDFATLFPAWGHPGLPPWRLALVTLMQFRENLADRQAAEAVRARIDWKYLLSLELTDPGFDFSVLSEFRTACWQAVPKSCCWRSCWSAVGRYIKNTYICCIIRFEIIIFRTKMLTFTGSLKNLRLLSGFKRGVF
jgi:Transposase domain (DUF772)